MASGWENSLAVYTPKGAGREKALSASVLPCCLLELCVVSQHSLPWIKFSGICTLYERGFKSSLFSHLGPNLIMEILSFFVDRVNPERRNFLPFGQPRHNWPPLEKWRKRHDENQPSFPLFASYHGELLLSIFSSDWHFLNEFFYTYHDFFFFQKSHFSFPFFLFFYFVNSTCGWLLSAHLFSPEVAAVVWPWLYRDCLSVSRWVGGFCFCAGYSLVLEPVFIKTDVSLSLFTPMPRLDELVSSSKVE